MAKLSLCLIARDEERFLGDCLASVADHVDEMIVVDTGSTDGTREIARAAGAQVVEFAWIDDFSAARNAALDAATGTHVLVLDADERLVDESGSLRRAADDPRFSIGMLAVHDAATLDANFADVLSGRARLWEPCFVPRFFVRDPELRFARRVHETIGADSGLLDSFLRRRRSQITSLDAGIVHLGEVPALRVERSKRSRNTRLLELALRENETDGDLAGFLALELFRAGKTQEARALAEKCLPPFLAELQRLPKDAPKLSPVQLAGVLATCLVQEGAFEHALAVVRESHDCCVEPHPNLMFLEGAALEGLQRYDQAYRAFAACLEAHGRRFTIPVNPGATTAAPRLRLANLALIAGKPDAALAHLDAQTWSGAFEMPAILLRAEALLQRGEAARALMSLTPVLSRTEAPPDLFALAACAAEKLGTPEPALQSAAESLDERRWLESRRRALIRRS